MIIPSLVLISAMQFADPQSGARIEDLSSVQWREVPVVAMADPGPTRQNDEPAFVSPEPTAQPNVSAASVTPTVPPANTVYSPATMNAPDPDAAGTPRAADHFLQPMPGEQVTFPTNTPPVQTNLMQNVAAQPSGNRGAAASQLSGSGYTAYGASALESRTILENGVAKLSRSVVEFDKISKLSAPVGGIVIRLQTPKYDEKGVLVKRSDGEPIWLDLVKGVTLQKGQEVCFLDSTYVTQQYNAAQVKLVVAKKEAAKDIEIRFATESLKTAETQLRRSRDINARTPGVVTDSEIDLQNLKVTESVLQVEKARSDQDTRRQEVSIQEAEVNVAMAQLELRKVKTPFNSVVMNVLTQEGNYLREGEQIAEVAQLDKLKVLSSVDGNLLTQEQINGKRVTVTATYPNGRTEDFEGFVRFASPSFVDSMKRFPVEIEVTNRQQDNNWLLKQGDFVDVVIHLQ